MSSADSSSSSPSSSTSFPSPDVSLSKELKCSTSSSRFGPVSCSPPVIESRDSLCSVWGTRTPYNGEGEWPIRVDERVVEQPDEWVQSACVLCSNGCALDIGVKNGKLVGVRGREVDRVNKGRLGPKGLHCFNVNGAKDRLTRPLIRNKTTGKLEPASWDEAMNLIVSQTKSIVKEMSQHAVGFYTSGQLFLEEYYTLAVVGKVGFNSLHMDGNTRLCTATAATAMRETFGSDGQPGSYTDIDVTDCILMVGHNMAATQTVLFSRILDRLAGPNPPVLIVIDPRKTDSAAHATVHLRPKAGTNLAILNGMLHLLFEKEYVNQEWIQRHTVGIEDLKKVVKEYTPEKVEEITQVPAADLNRAVDLIGRSSGLLSTALQGVYQSNQATASACQINNITLVLGRIGKPGCGILQMNGQPTAQNNRETGCNGEFPAFRNHQNPKHMEDLAKHWNVEVDKVPHWRVPTHIMEMLRFIESGTMKMFWVSGTNPCVSLPDLGRIRRLLSKPDLFLVVQDIFLTETAAIASVVLPAAMWGEKTGTFTNADRTVHISHKAVDPPGEAKSDLDIWIDFANRMEWKDKDGQPLIKWKTPEEAFNHWKGMTGGRPCDYTGMSYARLTGGSGIQWPCNQDYPDGKERLFEDGRFPTDLDHCESFGHDLETGTPLSPGSYRKLNPSGKAILKAAHYREPDDACTDEYPFTLNTGRNVFHFHTRTKTGRNPHLRAAAPHSAYVQLSEKDAKKVGVENGEIVSVESRRGKVVLEARVGGQEEGTVFIPFHYGYWDSESGGLTPEQLEVSHRLRAANELTRCSWDPISKQPYFKTCAVRVVKLKGEMVPTFMPNKLEEKNQTNEEFESKEKLQADSSAIRGEAPNSSELSSGSSLTGSVAGSTATSRDEVIIYGKRKEKSLRIAEEEIVRAAEMSLVRQGLKNENEVPFAVPNPSVDRKLDSVAAPHHDPHFKPSSAHLPNDFAGCHVPNVIALCLSYHSTLMKLYDHFQVRHEKEAEMKRGYQILAGIERTVGERIKTEAERYITNQNFQLEQHEPVRLAEALFPSFASTGLRKVTETLLSSLSTASTPVNSYLILMDLVHLSGYLRLYSTSLTSLGPTSAAMLDSELHTAFVFAGEQVTREEKWVMSQIKSRGSQTLIVPPKQ